MSTTPGTGSPVYFGGGLSPFDDTLMSPGGIYPQLDTSSAAGGGAVYFSSFSQALPPFESFGGGFASQSGNGTAASLVGAGAPDTAAFLVISWASQYTTDGAGLSGDFGSTLAVQGYLPAADSYAWASLTTGFAIFGVDLGNGTGRTAELSPLYLAAYGLSSGNDIAVGGIAGQAAINHSGSYFQGAAFSSRPFYIDPNTSFYVVSTLTLVGDPASISTLDFNPDLVTFRDTHFPDVILNSTTATPEPSMFLLLGGSLLAAGWLRRRPRA